MTTEELPPGWAWATLGDLCDVLDTERMPVKREDRSQRCANKPASALFPYFGATGQVGFIDGYRSEGDAILLGEDGAPFLDPVRAKAYRVRGRYWVNNHAHILKARDPCSQDFILHQLNCVDYTLHVSGTTRLKLTLDALRKLPLKLAPAREAATIGSVVTNLFDELDEAEAALVRARDGVEQFRASLLHAACTGQLTAAWREASPPAETGADLLRRILDERRTAWERTERARLEARGNMPRGDAWKARYVEPTPPDLTDLPRLPEGWVWASLEQICEIVGGITVDSKRDGSDLIEVPYLRVANVQRGYLKLAQMKTIKAPPVIIEKLLLQPNDLLMNEGGDRDKLGRGWVWNGELPACIHQNHVYRARPYLASIDARFLSHYLNEIGRAFFFDAATQTVNLASVNMSKVSRAPVPFPPEAEIAEIIRMVGDMLAQTERGMTAAEQTQELRQSILHAAFTGRLVPQNSTDEPAAALLARVRATAAPSHRARRTTAAVSA